MVHLISFAECEITQLASALPADMDKYEAIFIPINDGKPSKAYSGSHWSIMVYVRATNSFYYYDTLKFSNLREGEKTSKRMQPLLHTENPPQFIPASTPQQTNSSDCGGKNRVGKETWYLLYLFYVLVLVISIIDYILHQLLKCRCQKTPVKYSSIMSLDVKHMSTPAQVRYNINNMIHRLEQRRKSSYPSKS